MAGAEVSLPNYIVAEFYCLQHQIHSQTRHMERSDQGLPSPSCVIPSNLQSTVSPSCCRAQHSHRYSPSNVTISKPCGNTHSLWKIRNTTYGEQLITLTAQEQQLLSTRCSLLPTTVSRWGTEYQMCVFFHRSAKEKYQYINHSIFGKMTSNWGLFLAKVLAYTSAGDGVFSSSVSCATEPDGG